MTELAPKDEWLDPYRRATLEHGGNVHIQDPSMGIDMSEASVTAYFLRAIYYELRQIRIYLHRQDDRNSIL